MSADCVGFVEAIKPIFVVNENAFEVNYGVENAEPKNGRHALLSLSSSLLLSRLCTSGAHKITKQTYDEQNTTYFIHAFTKHISTHLIRKPERIEFFGITKID